ncbi:MAG TPA: beta-aspartyl-peptidase [Candidatus Heimdallarchaeota archaeon]|nr:beta-aspartyl-peptidase [Candidatus Heimdallarchaeota archaeon]
MKNDFQFTFIRGGKLYSPEQEGARDLLVAGDRIARITAHLDVPKGLDVEIVDAEGKLIVPGFVDLHVHLIGGGGEDGPTSRVPEIALSELTQAGITTVVGVLGTDNVTRSPEALLAKVKALCQEGISAYMYTGSYHLPSVTITGSVKRDIALIEEVIGVKVAIADHRGSQVTFDELARLASEARLGGMLGKKAGIVHAHVGRGQRGLGLIFDVVEKTEIPVGQFLPTHIAKNAPLLEQAVEFAKRGGTIDITAHDDENQTVSLIKELLDSGIDLANVTISSDGNGSMPRFNDQGELIGMATGNVASLGEVLRNLVNSNVLSLSDTLRLITSNPADRLGLSDHKGRIQEGADADLVILDEDLRVDQVFAKGQLMVDEGNAVVKGTFE